MRANLTAVYCLVSIILLSCAGCESEPKTSPAKSAQQATAEQGELQSTEGLAGEQTAQPSQEEIERAQAEVEMMIQQEQAKQAAPQPRQVGEAVEVQPAPAEPVPAEPAPVEPVPTEPNKQLSPDDVIATVNGIPISRGQVDELVAPRLEAIKEKKLPGDYLEDTRKKLTQQATEAVIVETLIGEQMKKHNIVVTEQEIEDYITRMAARENMTVDDLKALVNSGKRTYEQWKQQMQFDKIIGVLKLAQMEGFGTADVNEADALAFYEQNKAHYEQPEQVRASHILIKPDTSDPNVDPNVADAAALQKAQGLLAQVKAGADFAQLAKENSACASAAQGGDLGFNTRESWIQPFSDAAFALQIGQVSDVVKTRYGYHIIKVTDRKEASLIPFDQVKDQITKMLQGKREMELGSKYVKSLRDKAEVVYTEGEQPDKSGDTTPH
jgi:peptidyl-prolyl cis-trans isomerase C